MINIRNFIRKIPVTWFVPFLLLGIIALISNEGQRNVTAILKILYLFAVNWDCFESMVLVALVIPAGYYSGLFETVLSRNKVSNADVRFLYATHILKRIVINVDNIQRKYLWEKDTKKIPLKNLELAHQEFCSAINVFRYDAIKLQEQNGYIISHEELEVIMEDDKSLFEESPLKNLQLTNVFQTIEALSKY